MDFTYVMNFKNSPEITVVGIDNLNSYYSPRLKNKRLKLLKNIKNLNFSKLIFQIMET